MRMRIILPTLLIAACLLVGMFLLRQRQLQRVRTASSTQESAAPLKSPLRTSNAGATATRNSEVLIIDASHAAVATSEVTDASADLASVKVIINPESDAWLRQKAARALHTNLSSQQRKLLMEFLAAVHVEDESQVGQVLKNDVMDALVAQREIPADLAGFFAAIYRDTRQNIVIRDYAVQHLSLLSERLAGLTTTDQNFEHKQIQDVLWDAVSMSQSSVAGTALLGLTRIFQGDGSVDQKRLREAALKIASGADTQEAARITALQVCARLNATEALPVLSETAQNGPGTAMRISGIGAIGLMGGREEIGLLEKIRGEGNPRLESVLSVALRRIRQRLGP